MGIVEVQDSLDPIEVGGQPVSSTGTLLKIRRVKLPQFPPLGPPDMLHLRKRYAPVVGSPKLYG